MIRIFIRFYYEKETNKIKITAYLTRFMAPPLFGQIMHGGESTPLEQGRHSHVPGGTSEIP